METSVELHAKNTDELNQNIAGSNEAFACEPYS